MAEKEIIGPHAPLITSAKNLHRFTSEQNRREVMAVNNSVDAIPQPSPNQYSGNQTSVTL